MSLHVFAPASRRPPPCAADVPPRSARRQHAPTPAAASGSSPAQEERAWRGTRARSEAREPSSREASIWRTAREAAADDGL
eukprot:3411140-Pleurochrysis_carterae.AAC.2